MSAVDREHPKKVWSQKPKLHYRLAASDAKTHTFDIALRLEGFKEKTLELYLPVWIPGSYLVREFAQNVHSLLVEGKSRKPLPCEKIRKNRWRIEKGDEETLRVSYRVYGFDVSPRTSFLDEERAFVNGATLFLCPAGAENIPVRLALDVPEHWLITTVLESAGQNGRIFQAPSYHALIDSPIQMGGHEAHSFEVRGIEHVVAVEGSGNYEPEKLVRDVEAIVKQAINLFDEIPYTRYAFLVTLRPGTYGGLEHENCCTLLYDAWGFRPEEAYRKWLHLVAHEFFHLWNVKRMRPRELIEPDYSKENYTRLLWIAEGVTSYYDRRLVLGAGLMSAEDYLKQLAKEIGEFQLSPGRNVESLSDSSFDAWIKFYRRNENTPNVCVSYYQKGALVALLLDLTILWRTKGKMSLDDVLVALAQHCRHHGGYSGNDFQTLCERVAGGPLDNIFKPYVFGTEEIEFQRFLNHVGLKIVEIHPEDRKEPDLLRWIGASTEIREEKTLFKAVLVFRAASEAGVSPGDELIALDGWRVKHQDFPKRLQDKNPGSRLHLTIARGGFLRELTMTLPERCPEELRIQKLDTPDERQRKCRERWLGGY